MRRDAFVTTCLLTLASAAVAAQLAASRQGILPAPAGSLGIGRVTVHWTDTSRVEPLAADRRNRELVVDIWYPAEKRSGPVAQYINVGAFDQALGTDGLGMLFGARAAGLVRAGDVQTHAVERAPFTRRADRCPVLIFSHGMGTVTQLYTAQFEDLVSHGYVVVAITHPYDAWLTMFPGGRFISFERDRRNAAGNSEEARIAYENNRVEWWASDIRFTLDELTRLNQSRSAEVPAAGHLDLQRIGAFGHSVGGRAAARACQLDDRLRACADQDGVARMMPFYPDASGSGMLQPFLLIDRERTKQPTDDELRKMGFTRAEADALVSDLRAKRDAAMAATGGGYRVALHFESTNHMSFSDLMMLQAPNSTELGLSTRVFQVTSRYTRAFFDKTLRGMKAPLLDGGSKSEFVDSVRRYPRAPARKS